MNSGGRVEDSDAIAVVIVYFPTSAIVGCQMTMYAVYLRFASLSFCGECAQRRDLPPRVRSKKTTGFEGF